MTRPEPGPSPEGGLIRLVRESSQPSLSIRAAALAAGISETHWRHVEAGYESKGGMKIPVRVSAKTLAHMAWAVQIDPDRLEEHRPDAARILREIIRQRGKEIPMSVRRRVRALNGERDGDPASETA